MPGPDITRPKNKGAVYFIFLSWALWAGALVTALAQPVAGHAGWEPSQVQSEPAQPAPSSPPPTSAQPSTSKESQSGAAPTPAATRSEEHTSELQPGQQQNTERRVGKE